MAAHPFEPKWQRRQLRLLAAAVLLCAGCHQLGQSHSICQWPDLSQPSFERRGPVVNAGYCETSWSSLAPGCPPHGRGETIDGGFTEISFSDELEVPAPGAPEPADEETAQARESAQGASRLEVVELTGPTSAGTAGDDPKVVAGGAPGMSDYLRP